MNFCLSQDRDVLETFASEVNLESEPELVAGVLHAAGSKQNRIAKPGVLPPEIKLGESVAMSLRPIQPAQIRKSLQSALSASR
jgi:hypothetical protein